MTRFHSTISRRNFMKALGLGTAAVAAAGVAAPVYQDLDDLALSEPRKVKRPWYVKERDHYDLTVNIDWSAMKRENNNLCLDGRMPGKRNEWIFGPEKTAELLANAAKRVANGVKNKEPGMTMRDKALERAAINPLATLEWAKKKGANGSDFVGLDATYGVAKWDGTPEDNTQMIRALARFIGISQIYTGPVDDNVKKLIFTRHVQNIPIVYEQGVRAYYDETKYVIPDKQLYAISVAVQMNKDLYRQGIGVMREAANEARYRVSSAVQNSMQTFIYQLGYDCIGYPGMPFWGAMPAVADAVLTGHAEMARNDNYCISPEYGPVCGYFSLITDMPLAADKPIDAGIFKFCHTCKKCAETCPMQCISYENKPTYEIPNSSLAGYENVPMTWKYPGKEVFQTDALACNYKWTEVGNGCGTCMATCTFNVNNGASIHEIVKSTLATTSLFNGFLWRADKFYGYDISTPEQMEEWWYKNYSVLGINGEIGADSGAYNK